MKKGEKGFTLLEAVFAILLFAMLTQMLMSFFMTMYKNGRIFQKQTYLMDNARTASAFIKEEIRQAEKIEITLEDGKKLGFDEGEVTSGEVIPGEAKEIDVITLGDSEPIIKLIKNSGAEAYEGTYSLVYQGNSGVATYNTISTMVKSIKISINEQDEVTFECVYAPTNPQDEGREQVTEIFSESLRYKK